jgi:flagellar hook-associated protein 2
MPTVDGIVSQIDTTSLIRAVLAPRQVAIDTLQSTIQNYERQKEAVAGIKSRLTTLSESIGKMKSLEDFVTYKVDSTSSQFSITTTSDVSPGDYSIRVVSLASAQTSYSQGFDDKSADTLGTGTFKVTVGGATHDIALANGSNSLEDLAEALGELDGVSAYVVDTGAAVGRYKLMVQGDETGAVNAITFDGTGLAGGLVPSFTNHTDAQDAEVSIGGVSVFSASNTLDGVIPGIKLEFEAEGASADTAKISEDPEAMRAKLKEVVDSYNAVVDYYAAQSSFNEELEIRGPLVGESTTRRTISDLSSMFSSQFVVAGTPIESLSMLGISTGRDGKLEFDEEAFDEAMSADPVGVQLFLATEDSPLNKIATRIDELYVDSDNGVLVTRQEGLDSSIEDLQERIAQSEMRMESQAKILRDQFTAMETILGQIQAAQGYLASVFSAMPTTGT